jgi:peptidyl-prolyl cis-trans isomerase D
MITLIRKNQKGLMIFITILIVIAFVWLYNDTNLDKVGTDRVATIYGKTLTLSDVDRSRRMMQLNGALQQFDYLQALIGNVVTDEQALEAFALNQVILKKEADDLGIHPSDDDVATAMRNLSAFQNEGRFDVARYSQFLEQMLAPNGFTEAQLEEAIRNELRFQKIRDLVGSATGISEQETRELFDRGRRKMAVSVVRISRESVPGEVTVTDEEIKARYDAAPESYQSEEKRVVRFVKMELPEEARKLEGRERVAGMQALSDRAGEFTQAMLEEGADFEQTAGRFDLEVQTTGEFSRTGTDPAFEAVPALVPAAFSLTEQDPNSDAITFKDGFYILQLDRVIPSQPLSFEEAREGIATTLREEQSRVQLLAHAEALRQQISEAMKGGTGFAEAAKTAGVEAEIIPPFSLAEPDFQIADLREIAMSAMELKPGEISSFTPTASGGLLVFLERYEPVPDDVFATEKSMITESLLENRRNVLFREWLRERRDAARIRLLNQS